jgi:hypothetical protein
MVGSVHRRRRIRGSEATAARNHQVKKPALPKSEPVKDSPCPGDHPQSRSCTPNASRGMESWRLTIFSLLSSSQYGAAE